VPSYLTAQASLCGAEQCEQRERKSHSEGIHILLAFTKEMKGGRESERERVQGIKLRLWRLKHQTFISLL